MARIKPINRKDVPELEPVFSGTEKRMGFLPNSQLIMAYKPKLVQAFAMLSQAIHDPENRTSRQLRALVANAASKSAGCQYCVAHTAEIAHHASIEDRKISAIGQFETSPLFTEAERVALRFAKRASEVPNAVTADDFAAMRQHYSDQEIVEIAAVVSYFGFLNRWNDTFATELEASPLDFAEAVLSGTGWSPGEHKPQSRSPEASI